MVGVPRSLGCGRCVRKHIKCDQTRPACRECERRNQACPGYPQKYPFCNRDAGSGWQRRHKNQYVVSYSPGVAQGIEQQSAVAPSANNQAATTSMDAKVEPTLLGESLHTQYLEILNWFGLENWLGFQACFGARVEVTWMRFTFSPNHHPPDFLRLAIRCLSTLYLGQTQNQSSVVLDSQRLYQDALGLMKKKSVSPSNFSHFAYVAVFTMAVYEIKSGLSQGSWLNYINVIETWMRLDTPAAFSSGFGRTLFLTFRPFLIRAAFAQNKTCFLGEVEWVDMVESTVRLDCHRGNDSILGELVERATIEVTKAPGLAARTMLCMQPNTQQSANVALTDAVLHFKDRLKKIQEHLSPILKDIHDAPVDMTTPLNCQSISLSLADRFAQGCLAGIQHAVDILTELEYQVAHRLEQGSHVAFTLDSYEGRNDGVIIHSTSRSCHVSSEIGWLGRCALSLGVCPSP